MQKQCDGTKYIFEKILIILKSIWRMVQNIEIVRRMVARSRSNESKILFKLVRLPTVCTYETSRQEGGRLSV